MSLSISRHLPRSGAVFKLALRLVLLLCLQGHANPGPGPVSEEDLKIAFIYNFTRYTTWPNASAGSEPLRICVAGASPISNTLMRTLQGRSSGARPLQLAQLVRPDESQHCDVLFLPDSEERQQVAWLNVVRDQPVLTIGESLSFAQDGGVIHLLMVHDGVRFDVNLDAARRAGLQFNSRMLGLAREVHGGGRAP